MVNVLKILFVLMCKWVVNLDETLFRTGLRQNIWSFYKAAKNNFLFQTLRMSKNFRNKNYLAFQGLNSRFVKEMFYKHK